MCLSKHNSARSAMKNLFTQSLRAYEGKPSEVCPLNPYLPTTILFVSVKSPLVSVYCKTPEGKPSLCNLS